MVLKFGLFAATFLLWMGCSTPRPASVGVYWWRTTLDWSATDSANLTLAGADRIGLHLFDWGPRGEVGPLAVRSPIPGGVEVVPVAYVTSDRLAAWAADPHLVPAAEASALLGAMERRLATAWSGVANTWQLDADWSASNRRAWFAVAEAFRQFVHDRGARFEVTVRLHQYRDRGSQGIPPADGGVLMFYGAGDKVLDADLVASYLRGDRYPLALTPAWPAYTQVRQVNGYGRLVALHRIGDTGELPLGDLESEGNDRYRVVRRATLGGRPLMARDELIIDRVDPAEAARVGALPEVLRLGERSGGRLWVFDYDRNQWSSLVSGPLSPFLFPRKP
jgi:hypothetical protein